MPFVISQQCLYSEIFNRMSFSLKLSWHVNVSIRSRSQTLSTHARMHARTHREREWANRAQRQTHLRCPIVLVWVCRQGSLHALMSVCAALAITSEVRELTNLWLYISRNCNLVTLCVIHHCLYFVPTFTSQLFFYTLNDLLNVALGKLFVQQIVFPNIVKYWYDWVLIIDHIYI